MCLSPHWKACTASNEGTLSWQTKVRQAEEDLSWGSSFCFFAPGLNRNKHSNHDSSVCPAEGKFKNQFVFFFLIFLVKFCCFSTQISSWAIPPLPSSKLPLTYFGISWNETKSYILNQALIWNWVHWLNMKGSIFRKMKARLLSLPWTLVNLKPSWH